MEGPYIAALASLVGDPGRANMLIALMGGQALTAKELALAAGVSPPTASGHLGKLVDGKLLVVVNQGRHRYFQLASAKIAELLEALMETSIDVAARFRPPSIQDATLIEARTCYDHLAGRIAVAIADALRDRGMIELAPDIGRPTAQGKDFFAELGVKLATTIGGGVYCRPCLDWSERRLHIGGALGRGLLSRFAELGWIRRQPGSRALAITHAGRNGIREVFGVDPQVTARTLPGPAPAFVS